MDFQNRNKDLTEVFDQRYNANHNYDNIKQKIDNQNEFMKKMYNIPDKDSRDINREVKSTKDATLERLNEKLGALNNHNRFNK